MGKRCVSTCRGIGEEECVKPCSFTRKKYCRLSASLKMIPPDCRVVKRGREKRSITPNKILPVIRSLGTETPSPIKIRRLASGTPQSGTRGSTQALGRIHESNTELPKSLRRKSRSRKSRSTKSRSKKNKPAK